MPDLSEETTEEVTEETTTALEDADTNVSQETEESTDEVEDVTEEAETESETEEAPDITAALAAQASQITALRTMVRELRTEAAVAGAQAIQATAGVHAIDPDQLDAIDTPNVLNLQNKLNTIVEDQGTVATLQATLASMQANPAMYPDINSYCTTEAMEEVLERIAVTLVDRGMAPAEAGLQAQISLWSMDNPYAYVYTATKAAQAPTAAKPKLKPLPEVIPSPAAISGGGKGSSGWTAKKLDNMSEHQLDSVPPDVYQRWMTGELK